MMKILESVVIFLSFNFVKLEVSPNFAKCIDKFFYMNTAPLSQGLVGSTQICQRLGNQYYYATEYDTKNRIPYYSLYTLSFDKCGSRYDGWFVEPQLADKNDPSMVLISGANNNIATFGRKQAVNVDYTDSGYDRGHLNPQLYHCETRDSRKATNSLTNIAPQVPTFNQGIWNKFENTLYDISKKYCNFVGARRYYITGVLPSNDRFISNGRVNVPDHYWTAVCCDSSGANGTLRNEGAHLEAVMCAIKLSIWFTLCNTCVTVEDGYVELVFAIITPTFNVETSINSTITDISLPMSDTTDDSCRTGTAYTSGVLAITSS
ncbi:unnamed protein product [Mytilus edulis]|uniref:Endonuclease domain-containing 1 protein-like n=1 Tax=Mytilus edulis TaxID=6550 RepID=A0A8S3QPN2_MYTED|nr:unnamed protein product [Mytilus edulis]